MLNEKQKIKLILLFRKGIITKNQLQLIVKVGYPAPVIMETPDINENEKEILTLSWIYRILGQSIIAITFEK